MITSANGRKLIERYEGLFLYAYDDYNDRIARPGETIKGTITIGYGHTDAAGPPRVYAGQEIDEATADAILSDDLHKVENEVDHLVTVPLTQNQFDALVSFHFNTGALGKSTLLKKLNQKDYSGAAAEFPKWNKASGRVLEGLTRRRNEEAALFTTAVKDSPVASTSAWQAILNLILSIFKGK